jgi:hypothetical protein
MLLAAETSAATFDLSSIMSDAVSTVQSSIFNTLGVVVPALVAVTAAVVGVRFGLKWLRQLGKN